MAQRFAGQALILAGQAPPLAPPSVLRHHSSPPFSSPPRPLSKSTGTHREGAELTSPNVLVSTFLSHHHSLETLCENEGLERPDAKTAQTLGSQSDWSCVRGFCWVGDEVLVLPPNPQTPPSRSDLDLCFP